jgi:hypothetical protein
MFDARSNTPIFDFVRPKKVNSMRFTFRPFFIPLAILFLFNALGGDMLIGEVWAARSSAGLTSVGLDSAGSPSPLKSLSASTFTLPQDLGYIQESVEVPNSGRTVIHIQDAHCNYAAQKSIAGILNYLTTEYGIYAVNCEGGAESYDLSPFTAIPEKDIREKTADYFVKEGVVSAAEYYAVNNPQRVKLWGVEDPDLYLKNLKVYRDSLAHKAQVDRYIKSIEYILNNLKRHIYSNELLEFDRQYTGYKENRIGLKEYMLYLISMAHNRMIDIKSFSNIYLLSQILADEDRINFTRAKNEKDEIVDKMKKSLSRNEIEELMAMAGKLKTERISQADFYAYLAKKAKSVNLDISGYSELQKYMIYISLYSAMDRTKVTKEMNALEDRIKESLYENDTQRELGILSKNLVITKNIFNISLTIDDYIYYREHEGSFAAANYVSFIDKKAPLYKISTRLDKNIGSLDGYRESMDQFYECSLERDKAFIKNIKFTEVDRPNSIIITGGFHTKNLRELFKNEAVSYISIMPKFKMKKDYESPYMKRLAGQRTALENVIDTAIPAILNLQVVEILSTRLALEVEGAARLARFSLAVAIVAAVMRGKEFILKIDADIPVKGTDDRTEKFITFSGPQGADAISHSMTTASQMSAQARERFDAVLTGMTADTFVFKLNPIQSQAGAASVPDGGQPSVEPGVGPAVQPEEASALPMSAPDAGFARDMRRLSGDFRRGVFNVFLIKATPETIAGQTAIGHEAMNVFEKKFGIDTVILYYTDIKGQRAQLKRMNELLLLDENRGKYPMAFANCMNLQELKVARTFINRNSAIKDMVAIGRDFGIGKNRIPEEVKVMFVGSTMMNDKRLSKAINIDVEYLFESRKNILRAFESNGIIRISDINKTFGINITGIDDLTAEEAELIDSIMNNIWTGTLILNCSKVDWKTFDEWKSSQRQLLQSV